jgi:hypothetical protein
LEKPETPRTLEEATDDLVKYIDAHEDGISQAIIQLRRHDMRNIKIAKIVKNIFEFFNDYVFMNKLCGRVSFHGYGAYDNQRVIDVNDSGKTIASFSGYQGVHVILNSDVFEMLFETREVTVAQDFIIAAVLHQMIHAYFVVVCGVQSEEKKACELLTHNEHFGIVMYKTKQCSETQGAPLPIDFGNLMPEIDVYPGSRSIVRDTGGLTLRSEMWADQRKISTECARKVKVLREEDCKDWYKNKCLKTLDPDIYVYSSSSCTFDKKPLSKCGSKSDWVELSHKKKSYKVARKAFDAYPSFKKNFDDSVRKLDISPDVRKETIEEFVRFLCEGAEEYFPLSLRTSIEVYKLALSLKFEELKEVMMDAISQAVIAHHAADAVLEVVRAVYGMPTQPDGPLRDWSVGFMKQMGAIAVRTATKDPRLSHLRNNSMALKSDLSRAAHELGPAAFACGEAYQGSRNRSQASRKTSSHTLSPPATVVQPALLQVTTTATPLPAAPYASSVIYHHLPYAVPADPIHPTRWASPALGWHGHDVSFVHNGATVPVTVEEFFDERVPAFGG